MLVVATVVGARPQFIKAAVVSRELRRVPGFTEVLVHTGQHYDPSMSDVFFQELGLVTPDYNLGVGSGTHGAQTGRMLEELEQVFLKVRPDWVLVYGDTNSTLAGALAAAKLRIPLAHVEAGLRAFNKGMPEELNRVLTDHISDLLLAPTQTALHNLRHEGLDHGSIRVVGDVMYDLAMQTKDEATRRVEVIRGLGLQPKAYVLATIHRAENTDVPARLHALFLGLSKVAANLPVVIPLHPRTKTMLNRLGLLDRSTPVQFVDPQGYLEMAALTVHARLVATDSGGLQKEAFFYRVPCVTLRDETEWVELVELGWNRLVAPTSDAAVAGGILEQLHSGVGREGNPYGDGHAGRRIAKALSEVGS